MTFDKQYAIEPNWQTMPEPGFYAIRRSKGVPEDAISIVKDRMVWWLYKNGTLQHECFGWEALAKRYPYGLIGRSIDADEYQRISQRRREDQRDGLDGTTALNRPAPVF